ncbi:acyl transferase/acyl hydrolase/lysophospholipase [Polychytrium aggregatum]|uniref:acyl transferase/acyl hydrolase/lysophospholipase n=1 Tax=Polychytrium aggregatum TaxID=110093 RepID=UPI0022FE038E|nr:acyl transferase/acyl hydrolase/lysophospholipase [Polychytrium aggregatum]KAI9203804.1 acyl transferase/acyl hydrolase/lysophospholipase [Polychytrium aggregatum]
MSSLPSRLSSPKLPRPIHINTSTSTGIGASNHNLGPNAHSDADPAHPLRSSQSPTVTLGPVVNSSEISPESRLALHFRNLLSLAGMIVSDVSSFWMKKIYLAMLHQNDTIEYFKRIRDRATNYEQWAAASLVLDDLEGNEKWKSDPVSPDYDYHLIQERLVSLKKARLSGDISSMIFLLRTSLNRDLGNMGNHKVSESGLMWEDGGLVSDDPATSSASGPTAILPQYGRGHPAVALSHYLLYGHTHIGTKRLIEDYIEEVTKQLNIICDTESDDLPNASKLDLFLSIQKSYGRTALLLSGGAIFGLTHVGVIKTLYETKLLPRIISGSSCGAIIAAVLCTRTDSEVPYIFEPDTLNLNVFESAEDHGNIFKRLLRILKDGVVFDVQVFVQAMRDNVGDLTFLEAFNKTRRVLNITVSTSTVFEMPKLLNYLTAPNVIIWSAVTASCAIPYVYKSAPLMAKDRNGKIIQWNPSGHKWIDGSVENDLPIARLSELFNVNHFIVSQVNPHVVPFMQDTFSPSTVDQLTSKLSYLIRSEAHHRLYQLSELGLGNSLLFRVQAILVQRYYGDITIVPDISPDDYTRLVGNPDSDMLVNYTITGERATWPKVSIMRNHCLVELCIDEIIYRLRIRKFEADSDIPRRAGGSERSSVSLVMPSQGSSSAGPSNRRDSAPTTT